jgi:hypothetical protein
MLERDRRRNGLRVCSVALLLGLTVREYREIEAGDRTPYGQTIQDDRRLRLAIVAMAADHNGSNVR